MMFSRSKNLLSVLSLVTAGLASFAFESAKADVFRLDDGGQIEGELVDRGGKGEYVVKSRLGAIVTLTRRQVLRVEKVDKVDKEYAQRSRILPDTLAAHRELAAWCKEHRLSKQANHHLRRILELDSQDEQARLSLGFQKHQGRWMTRDEIMRQRGLQFYKGHYRTPQDIALREQQQQRETAEAEWFRKIRLWLGWLNDPRKGDEAAANISAIRDPHATVAIVKLLESEEDQEVRDFLTAMLAELDHPLAVITLVDFSLEDPLHEVRLQCLDYLLARGEPISLIPYVNALDERRNSNEIINRSAEALQVLGNPEAISPLIDALVTTHKYKDTDAPPGEYNASFDPSGRGNVFGGGGLTLGGSSKVLRVEHQNIAARQALVELSGGLDFEFDEKAWRRWYVNEQIQEFVDTRRDQ
ncbi:MAG: hypothetical protein MI725_12130 [Pirellulales bacterium]|nr:hypothetical protein [Pirellulales bacterium]